MKKFLLLLLVVLFVFTACDNSIKPIRFAFGESESEKDSGVNPLPPVHQEKDSYVLKPLTIEFTTDATGTITITNKLTGMTFSRNGGEKEAVPDSGKIENIKKGDKIQLYANQKNLQYLSIQCDKDCIVYGNVMSLIKGENFKTEDAIFAYAFASLFLNNTHITSAENLILPTTNLTGFSGCYQSMFSGCSSLIKAPALPATTLANYCYAYMFQGCTSLTKAPALPATTLADSCYYGMFSGCTSLTQAPALPATTLASNCYYEMFRDCTSLTQAPPALPATTLKTSCYFRMFQQCTSLKNAPKLPAQTLNTYCYNYMFYGCTNLESLTCLATTASINDSYTTNWLSGVTTTGTIYAPEGVDWDPTKGQTYGIPQNWHTEQYQQPEQ